MPSAHTVSPRAVSPIAAALIAWHREHGRHELPWQQQPTPYRVWVSEVMLQQTQVATVLGYYQRFMQRFPTVVSLADASPDEVLHLWSGLGYYSRARNLQRAAQAIVRNHDGELPTDVEGLARLPGIGRSTAAAIVALAFGRRATILDGNVRRVLSRYFGIEGKQGARSTEQALWRCAEQCTPEGAASIYTQAIMDLGATVCTRRRPLCVQCPLSRGCVAFNSDRVDELPPARVRAARRARQVVMLLALRADGCVLLQRRPSPGVWGGLWAPPEFPSVEAAALFCSHRLAAAQLRGEPLPLLRHAFTHFDLEVTPLVARCAGAAEAVMEGDGALWYNTREPARIGLPAPIAALLSSLSA